MSYSVSCSALGGAKHVDDVESCVFSNGRLYTGSDDGVIKVRAHTSVLPSPHLLYCQCWNSELELVEEWQAHQYVVYDLAADQGWYLSPLSWPDHF